MPMILLALLLLVLPARAEVFAPGCAQGAGFAGGFALAQRDWDFTTPGPVAFAGTPLVSTRCMGIAPGGSTTWFGAELVPLYRHSYRRLGTRGPLLIMGTWGRGVRWEGQMLGVQLLTNGLVWGGGLRWSVQTGYREGGLRPGLDVALSVLAGVEPDFQLSVRHELWTGPPRTRWEQRKWRKLMMGFDLGPLLMLRSNVRLKPGWFAPELAARIGSLTWPWGDALLQPTMLGELIFFMPGHPAIHFNRSDWYARFSMGGGTRLVDLRPRPLAGGAVLFHAYDRQATLRLGVQAGTDIVVADAGMGWVW